MTNSAQMFTGLLCKWENWSLTITKRVQCLQILKSTYTSKCSSETGKTWRLIILFRGLYPIAPVPSGSARRCAELTLFQYSSIFSRRISSTVDQARLAGALSFHRCSESNHLWPSCKRFYLNESRVTQTGQVISSPFFTPVNSVHILHVLKQSLASGIGCRMSLTRISLFLGFPPLWTTIQIQPQFKIK